MSDPAVEAAQRALKITPDGGGHYLCGSALAVASAREALKPIREVLDKLASDTEPPCDFETWVRLFEKAISDLSPLVYTTEELAS